MDRATLWFVGTVIGCAGLVGLVIAKVLYAPASAAPLPPAVECPPNCDFDAKAVSEVHTLQAYVGAPLDDAELQSLSDAQDILRCIAGRPRLR